MKFRVACEHDQFSGHHVKMNLSGDTKWCGGGRTLSRAGVIELLGGELVTEDWNGRPLKNPWVKIRLEKDTP